MNWNKFNAAALVGSLVLILVSPVWGHVVRGWHDTYKFDYIYAVYLIALPYILLWGAIMGYVAVYFWNKEE